MSIAAICDDLICLYVFECATCLHHPSIFLSSFCVCCCCYCWPLSFAIIVIRWDPASFHICSLSHFIGCCVCHFYSFVLFIMILMFVSWMKCALCLIPTSLHRCLPSICNTKQWNHIYRLDSRFEILPITEVTKCM